MVQELNSGMPTAGFMMGQKLPGMSVPSVQERLGVYAGRLVKALMSSQATLDRILGGALPTDNLRSGHDLGVLGINGLLDGIDISTQQAETLATRLEELQQRLGSL